MAPMGRLCVATPARSLVEEIVAEVGQQLELVVHNQIRLIRALRVPQQKHIISRTRI